MEFIGRRTKSKIMGLVIVVFCLVIYDKYNSLQEYWIMKGSDEEKKALLEDKKTQCTRGATTQICVCLNTDTGKKVDKTYEECVVKAR